MRIKGKGKSILTRQRLPVLGLFEGLLDQVSGAAAAYSIRLLRADYSDGLLRVRAYDGSSDQGEADVLPNSNNEISLSSPLTNRDSTAGSSGRDVTTLGELVDNGGANYDGFVSKWYDQTPNARHATNTTASEQPKIVGAGSLITENGKPALDADGGGKELLYGLDNSIATQPFTILAVVKYDNTSDFAVPISNYDSSQNRVLHYSVNDELRIFAGVVVKKTNFTNTNQILQSGIYNGANSILRLNGTQVNTGDVGNTDYKGISLFNQNPKRGDALFKGKMQEVLIYTNDLDANNDINTVEKNQDSFFSIPNF